MPDKGRDLNRRDFIKKSVGVAGLLAVLSTPLTLALKRGKVSANSAELTSGSPAGVASANEKVRAWCMVIDLKKCDGCATIDTPPQCTQACIQGHFVPKGQQWIQVYEAELPGGGRFFMPTPCFQCENAPCVNVCPVAATYHNKDGIVLIDHRRCIGCRLCMAACPYQRRFFNWGTPELPPEAAFAEYSPLYPVPAVKGTVIKCMFCAHMLREGKLPFCVVGCPMKALYMGDLNEDVASNGKEVVKLSRFLDENDAYRHKEDLGTQPRVWYLPGHGQEFGRKADDPREMKPATWSWGGEGYNRRVSVWPWGEAAK
ncbi:MAG: 4Fe-4S dicluster domain-containing protein [Chloroflexi bacterium]|nr:4Fe-4S dicluster domain-containing protein [Chloroflexota bacterium]